MSQKLVLSQDEYLHSKEDDGHGCQHTCCSWTVDPSVCQNPEELEFDSSSWSGFLWIYSSPLRISERAARSR
ncbi:unnamed protein product [Allacma fusca]|uniref:Uncharacterized protein n=1 Tax=Allacma fusca TaxID=39272 RepID=A0A8J2KF29_9HEXA|nr:unnamed protein product [Allacma fusca]